MYYELFGSDGDSDEAEAKPKLAPSPTPPPTGLSTKSSSKRKQAMRSTRIALMMRKLLVKLARRRMTRRKATMSVSRGASYAALRDLPVCAHTLPLSFFFSLPLFDASSP